MNRSLIYYLLIGSVIGLVLATVTSNALVGMGVGLGVAIAAFVVTRRGASATGLSNGGTYNELLSKARGDKSLVERLITFEQKRNPNGSRQDWVADALDRWERDRG